MVRRTLKVPPAALRGKVGNTKQLTEYVQIGSRTAASIRHLLAARGYDLSSFDQVLDFACGCGRTISFIRERVDPSRLYGCDSSEVLIAWCRRHLEIADWVVNQPTPPTPFPDSQFDLIYAISFFTHLDQESQMKWLAELRRLLKNDGIVVLSVLGTGTARVDSVSVPESGSRYLALGDEFNSRLCYLTQDYILSEWTRYFHVLDYSEMGLNDHQELVLLGGEAFKKQDPIGPDLPPELMAAYRTRKDLWAHFDERGLGYPDSQWTNLDLYDWALFDGGLEESSLSHLAFESRYGVMETD